jgi:hypothetical protein
MPSSLCHCYRFQTDFIVCGIAPFKDMLLLMAYVVDDIDEIAHVTSSDKNERKVYICHPFLLTLPFRYFPSEQQFKRII